MLYMVLYEDGVFAQLNEEMVKEIEAMPSFIKMEVFVKPGQFAKRTVDCFTFGGGIRLAHSDINQLNQDYNRIREMELNGLYQFTK